MPVRTQALCNYPRGLCPHRPHVANYYTLHRLNLMTLGLSHELVSAAISNANLVFLFVF
jgi:hypothetical protein